MADYKELLRRAVEALPENNGAARRAVYEKARAALVGQLRAINPPLPARDITTHRLQLEDCIRQVEQEASEAVIAGMGSHAETPQPPVYFEPNGAGKAQPALAKPQAAPAKSPAAAARPAQGKPKLVTREPPRSLPAGETIEEIIAAANAAPPAPEPKPRAAPAPKPGRQAAIRLASPAPQPEPDVAEEAVDEDVDADVLPPKPSARPGGRQLPSIVARAEAVKSRSGSAPFGVPAGEKPYDAPRRAPMFEPRREAPRLEPAARGGQAAAARQQVVEPVAFLDEPKVVAAMSAVREVEVEPQPSDPQGAIDRAIATLDREARGDAEPMVNEAANDVEDADENEGLNGKSGPFGGVFARARKSPAPRRERQPARPDRRDAAKPIRRGREAAFAEPGFPRARAEKESGGNALTIFLIVFAVLLAGTGGAGYWAVSQGYLDLSAMFSPGAPAEAATAPDAEATVSADLGDPATGPGNTATPEQSIVPATELAGEQRLEPEPALTGDQPLSLAATAEPPASEERLVADDADTAAEAGAAVASLDPVNIAGSQSLLLEASDDGTTGAVPFSGTVDWTRGTDETGQPTLVGKANIPARNLGVDVLIRRNSDPSLPASHLMEINFRVSDTFIGGSVAGLPGVLLKNEELASGTPLVGASARVVGNSFLFALSASPEDMGNNTSLLTGRKWLDLALIYATGKRAIITLEKDEAAEKLFTDVFAAWGQTASAE